MAAKRTSEESREGVPLTHLDEPLFDGSDATKRDLVDYVEQMADRMVPHLRNRPLSVIRVRAGQAPFMQKNLPKYTPDWVQSVSIWAERPKRDIAYALANDRRTLIWLANQRAVEYHPGLMTTDDPVHQTHLILDLDPPSDVDPRKASGSRSRPPYWSSRSSTRPALPAPRRPVAPRGCTSSCPSRRPTPSTSPPRPARSPRAPRRSTRELATTAFVVEERHGKVFVDSTRAGGATVITAYSPRIRPGVPVSFPVGWDDLEAVSPRDFTLRTAPGLLGDRDAWADLMPEPQTLPADLVAEGHEIPIAPRHRDARGQTPAPRPGGKA